MRICGWCLLIAASAAAAFGGGEEPAEDRAERLVRLVPAAGDLPDLEVLLEPTVFPRDELAELINGEAEAFYPYGVGHTVTSLVRQAEVKMKVDIFDMTSPLGAYGVYSTHRPPEPEMVEIGTLGFASDQSIVFFCGDYYVDLTVQGKPDGAAEALQAAAREIASRIEPKGAVPEELDLFPEEGRVADTDRYLPRGHLGIEQVPQAFVVEYEIDDAKLRASISHFESDDRAQDVFDGIREYVLAKGEEPREGQIGDSPLMTGVLKYRGAFAATRTGPYCLPVCGGENEKAAQELLGRVLRSVVDEE